MSFFGDIQQEADLRQLKHLVIGGHAVIAHGYPRFTFDFDLAIEREREAQWLECVGALGYTVSHRHETFLQLQSTRQKWLLDLMLLSEQTFAKLFLASEIRPLSDALVRVPSAPHLIALKVHALRHGHPGRFPRDFNDVVELVQRNKIDLSGAAMQETFRRYGTPDLYEQVRHACARR